MSKEMDYYEKLITLIETELYEAVKPINDALVKVNCHISAMIEILAEKGMINSDDVNEIGKRALKWQVKSEQDMERLKAKAIEEKNTPLDRAYRILEEEGIMFNRKNEKEK